VPWTEATLKFVGAATQVVWGGEEAGGGVDEEGPVGDEPTASELPHAPLIAAANRIDNTAARFIASTP